MTCWVKSERALSLASSILATARTAAISSSLSSFFQGGQFGVAGHAEAALVDFGGEDLDHFALACGERSFAVEFAHFLIEGEGFGRVGQHADEVGQKAVWL